MRKLAVIIPARGGSKGIPKKNIKKLNGKPLIDYTIEFAKNLNLKVFLTSDDDEILSRGEFHDISCIKRPKNLATDESRINETLIHASNNINLNNKIFDSLLVLQPTFLIRDMNEIKNAIKRFQNENLVSLVALTRMREHPSECINLDTKQNIWSYIIEGPKGATNRQEFNDSYYFISGNFYMATINSLVKYGGYMHNETQFYISEDRYIVDIDCPQDFEFAKTQIHRIKS